tara:strand:- start:10811 stop:11311 length:501 start_codon:yes stop_codon:yes gene_type:complete
MGFRRAFRRVVRRVTPKVKVNIKPPKINIKPPKINIKKPDIVKKLQTTASGGARQLKSNLQSATTTARSNVHGVTTAARTGVHTATDAARGLAHKGADTLKAGWDKARGKAPEETGGGGTGATQAAMGSETSVVEKGSGKMQAGQLAKKKRQKGNTGKDKFKVKVG